VRERDEDEGGWQVQEGVQECRSVQAQAWLRLAVSRGHSE
jgi:hypothetical protein